MSMPAQPCMRKRERPPSQQCSQCSQPTRSANRICRRCVGNYGRPRIEKTCPSCGQDFLAPSWLPHRTFCSKACQKGEGCFGLLTEKRCPTCAKAFKVPRHESKRLFCSTQCANGRAGTTYPPCPQCGTSLKSAFEKYCSRSCWRSCKARAPRHCQQCGIVYQPNTQRQFYCSPACMRISRRKPVTMLCRWCGVAYTRTPCRSGSSYCSQACRIKGHFQSKEEDRAVQVVADILHECPERQKTFLWLRSSKNRPLHLDAFFPLHSLAVEYDGASHRRFMPMYHRSRKVFQRGMERDKEKARLLRGHGITLLRIRDDEPHGTQALRVRINGLQLHLPILWSQAATV